MARICCHRTTKWSQPINGSQKQHVLPFLSTITSCREKNSAFCTSESITAKIILSFFCNSAHSMISWKRPEGHSATTWLLPMISISARVLEKPYSQWLQQHLLHTYKVLFGKFSISYTTFCVWLHSIIILGLYMSYHKHLLLCQSTRAHQHLT